MTTDQAPGDRIVITGYEPAVPLLDLQPFHRNPNRGDVETIRESLRATGQYRPLVVNLGTHTGRRNEILAGNHTYAALAAEGHETTAVTYVDVDEETAKRIVLVDNGAAAKATRDSDILAELLSGMDDLAGTAYSIDDLEKLLTETNGRAATGFLDGFGEDDQGAVDEDDDGEGDPAGEDDEGVPYFTVSWTVTGEDRDTIMTALRAAKANNDLATMALGLAHICRDYLTATGTAVAS